MRSTGRVLHQSEKSPAEGYPLEKPGTNSSSHSRNNEN